MSNARNHVATVKGWVEVPLAAFTRAEAIETRALLTFALPPDAYAAKDEEGDPIPDAPILNYEVDHGAGVVRLPLWFGMRLAAMRGMELVDERVFGFPVSYLHRPAPRDERQAQFFEELHDRLDKRGTAFACAPTGTGKTVTALNEIARRGCTALVVVPTVALAEQWFVEVLRHLKVPRSRVGMIGGASKVKNEWQGKDIVIAVVNTLAMREWPEEFMQAFGIAVWDEAHRMPARTFSLSLRKTHARYRIALSATPERKDGLTAVLAQWVGKVAVESESVAMPMTYHEVAYDEPRHVKWSAAISSGIMSASRVLSCLAKDGCRNEWIANKAARLQAKGRCVLILSDRIEHLHALQILLTERFHVEQSSIGIFAGKRVDRFEKVGRKLKAVTVAVKKPELKRIKEDATVTIILATFSMMKEGVDIPRIDCGIEALPKGSCVQACGRARRWLPDKEDTLWYSIIDRDIGLMQGLARARKKELRESDRAGNVFFKTLPGFHFTL